MIFVLVARCLVADVACVREGGCRGGWRKLYLLTLVTLFLALPSLHLTCQALEFMKCLLSNILGLSCW